VLRRYLHLQPNFQDRRPLQLREHRWNITAISIHLDDAMVLLHLQSWVAVIPGCDEAGFDGLHHYIPRQLLDADTEACVIRLVNGDLVLVIVLHCLDSAILHKGAGQVPTAY